MKVVVIGATGHVGAAVRRRLETEHEVIAVTRSSDPRIDITDAHTIGTLFERIGVVDAVVTTVGSVPFKPFDELDRDDFLAALTDKAIGQIEVVRRGIDYVRDGGSFTLTSGVVGREQIRTGVAAAAANGALEYFVPAAAVEMPRGIRINAVSSTVLAEAVEYHSSFPGFIPVPAATVAESYARSVDGVQTGRVFIVD